MSALSDARRDLEAVEQALATVLAAIETAVADDGAALEALASCSRRIAVLAAQQGAMFSDTPEFRSRYPKLGRLLEERDTLQERAQATTQAVAAVERRRDWLTLQVLPPLRARVAELTSLAGAEDIRARLGSVGERLTARIGGRCSAP